MGEGRGWQRDWPCRGARAGIESPNRGEPRPPAALAVGCVARRIGGAAWRVAAARAISAARSARAVVECEHRFAQLHSPSILAFARRQQALLRVSFAPAGSPAELLEGKAPRASPR